MIAWREKFVAFGVHFLATLALAACAAALIFLIWYPPPFTRMLGGMELFVLVVGIDLALGPLMSLVIYNSRKARSKLVMDYTIVGVIQIAAMIYGVWVMSAARPVYVAFAVDRLEIVQAQQLTPEERAAASAAGYSSLPWFGPRLVSVVVPQEEKLESLMKSIGGMDIHLQPRYYGPYERELPQIQKRARELSVLEEKHPAAKADIEAARREAGIPEEHQRWLPVHHAKGFWTAIIDTRTGLPVSWIDLDPY